jgi:hypothetical protein
MSDEKPRLPLTFSQAQSQGLEPLPSPLALGELGQHARIDLWNWLWLWMQECITEADFLNGDVDRAFRTYHVRMLHRPLDEYVGNAEPIVDGMKATMLKAPYNVVFDTIQFFLRLPPLANDPTNFNHVRLMFRINLLAYDLLDIPPDGPTIVPNASPEEGEVIREAFASLATGPFDGARHHLHQAAGFINTGDSPKAVAQTMHAVESVVRVIAPNNNFKQALMALNAKATMHPAL